MCNLHWCYTFCTGVTLFALVLHLNCTALSQSESSNFFTCIIRVEKLIRKVIKLYVVVVFVHFLIYHERPTFLFLSMSDARCLTSCHSKTILELWPRVASILCWFASLTDIFSYPNTVVNVFVPS